jgi:hypothetical protein
MSATAIAPREAPFTLAPRTMAEAMEFAKMVAGSALVPSSYRGKPPDVLICIQMGYELGLAPIQALQSIAVINGKPSVYGDGALALVKASGLLEDHQEGIEGDGDNRVGFCRMKRKGQETWAEARFSVADAKRAKLWTKSGPWTEYPERMLKMRARGFAMRDGFADVLRGLILREEAEDYPADATPSEPAKSDLPTPKRRSERQELEAPVGSMNAMAAGTSDTPLMDTLRDSIDAAKARKGAVPVAVAAQPSCLPLVPAIGADDGGAAPPPCDPETGEILSDEPRVNKKDLARIFAAAKDGRHPDDAVKRWLYPKYGVSSTKELPASKVNEVVMRLADPTELS